VWLRSGPDSGDSGRSQCGVQSGSRDVGSPEPGDRSDMSEVVQFISSQRFYLTLNVDWAVVMTRLCPVDFTRFVGRSLDDSLRRIGILCRTMMYLAKNDHMVSFHFLRFSQSVRANLLSIAALDQGERPVASKV
jgi:hypothetical protein